MKLGYRDRIILLIVMIIVVFAIGIFVFIKPQWEALEANKSALATAEKDWDDQLVKFNDINTIRDNINKRYEEALTISEGFTDEMDSTQLDQFLQETFMNTEKHIKNGVQLADSSAISDYGTASMPYYYYTPGVVTYPLYEYADFDGSLEAATKEKLKESTILAGRSTQTVGNGSAQLIFKINREDTMALIDAVRKYALDNNDAILLKSVEITDYDFNGTPLERDDEGNIIEDPEEPAEGENGEEPLDPEDIGYTQVAFDFQVYFMQEPTKPDVGEAYDASIWEGDAWKTYTSEKTAE